LVSSALCQRTPGSAKRLPKICMPNHHDFMAEPEFEIVERSSEAALRHARKPPQEATGNITRVVLRIVVKIRYRAVRSGLDYLRSELHAFITQSS
jgi:hypothetical protein